MTGKQKNISQSRVSVIKEAARRYKTNTVEGFVDFLKEKQDEITKPIRLTNCKVLTEAIAEHKDWEKFVQLSDKAPSVLAFYRTDFQEIVGQWISDGLIDTDDFGTLINLWRKNKKVLINQWFKELSNSNHTDFLDVLAEQAQHFSSSSESFLINGYEYMKQKNVSKRHKYAYLNISYTGRTDEIGATAGAPNLRKQFYDPMVRDLTVRPYTHEYLKKNKNGSQKIAESACFFGANELVDTYINAVNNKLSQDKINKLFTYSIRGGQVQITKKIDDNFNYNDADVLKEAIEKTKPHQNIDLSFAFEYFDTEAAMNKHGEKILSDLVRRNQPLNTLNLLRSMDVIDWKKSKKALVVAQEENKEHVFEWLQHHMPSNIKAALNV